MAKPTLCRGCQKRHDPLLTCTRAATIQASVDAAARPSPLYAMTKLATPKPVTHKPIAVTHAVTHTPAAVTHAEPAGNARNATKQAAYRKRQGDALKAANAERMRTARAAKKGP